MRRLWWVLAICAAVGVYKIVDASVSGHFTEKQQMHWLGLLFKVCIVAFLPVVSFILSLKEYRASADWKAWGVFTAVVVLYGGVWSWVGYFGDHGAFFIWPVIVGVVFVALLLVHGLAVEKRQKDYAEWLKETAPPPPEPSSPKSSKDRLKEKGLL